MLPTSLILTGGKPLSGTIRLHGAKNALPKQMVAALLTTDVCKLSNVAAVRDVSLVEEMIVAMGGGVDTTHPTELTIIADQIQPLSAEQLDEYAGKSRIPILMCGPMLNRFGKVVIPQLGGCNIGSRPVDFHIAALMLMGATIEEDKDYITMTAERLHGANIDLAYPSVGATEQVLLSAVLAEGVTTLTNAAIEPEILDLISVLNKMGASIDVHDRTMTISGVSQLHGFEHQTLPDRIEAASWACAAAASNGRILVEQANSSDMKAFLEVFENMGGGVEEKSNGLIFYRRTEQLSPVQLSTDVHPGFMTDWQQPLVVALTQASGTSVVHETVYEERFGYTQALNQMGANIQLKTDCWDGENCRFADKNYVHTAEICGPTQLHGTEVTIPDLRAGFSYVIAALVADGTSTLHNVAIIARGYEHFMEKLEAVGAQIIDTA